MQKGCSIRKKKNALCDKIRMNPSIDNSIRHEEFLQIGKVPDYVRVIPNFEGNASSIMRWILEEENVFRMYALLPRERGSTM